MTEIHFYEKNNIDLKYLTYLTESTSLSFINTQWKNVPITRIITIFLWVKYILTKTNEIEATA